MSGYRSYYIGLQRAGAKWRLCLRLIDGKRNLSSTLPNSRFANSSKLVGLGGKIWMSKWPGDASGMGKQSLRGKCPEARRKCSSAAVRRAKRLRYCFLTTLQKKWLLDSIFLFSAKWLTDAPSGMPSVFLVCYSAASLGGNGQCPQ